MMTFLTKLGQTPVIYKVIADTEPLLRVIFILLQLPFFNQSYLSCTQSLVYNLILSFLKKNKKI